MKTLQQTLASAHRAIVNGRAFDANHLLKIAQQQATEVADELDLLRREIKRLTPPPVCDLPAFLQRQAD